MKRFAETEEDTKRRNVCSLSNFNSVALLSMLLLGTSFILACVSIGMDEWSRLEVRRGATTARIDSGTVKTQGIARRCVSYSLSEELSNVPLGEQPRGGCLFVGDMECNLERSFLESAHDRPSINELQNTDNLDHCAVVKRELELSLSFMILGMLLTAIAIVLLFPLWHMGAFITGGILALIAFCFYAVSIGMFLGADDDFAGFFSLNGQPSNGCLWYSFGLAVASWLTNLMGGALGIGAFVHGYRKNSEINDEGIIAQ